MHVYVQILQFVIVAHLYAIIHCGPPGHPCTCVIHAPAAVVFQDLEYLIEKCVDPNKADFAVVAGVQIHNWCVGFNDANLEFVAPSKVYVVVGGEVTIVDLTQLPVSVTLKRMWTVNWYRPVVRCFIVS